MSAVERTALNNKSYVLIDWYLQQHGSFSSLGRWRDISLIEFSSTRHLTDYLFAYIQKNYPHVTLTDDDQQTNVFHLCQIAIEQSNELLMSNREEISRVTSRHIWPSNHKLLIGCLADARIVATCYNPSDEPSQHEERENDYISYCLITQLGNQPTDIKFVRGTTQLREELLQRFKHPFGTTTYPSEEQIERFRQYTQTLSIQQLCQYVTSRSWYTLDPNALHGVLVDFILAGEPVILREPSI